MTLRAGINVANPALAHPGENGADPTGIAVDLARAFAETLGTELQIVPYPSAGTMVAAITEWDVAFLAREPSRADVIAFTAPYLLIEGTYAVAAASRFQTVDEVDSEGVTVAVSRGAAYVPHLERTLTRAQIRTADTPPAAMALLPAGTVHAAAGVREALEGFAAQTPGVRVLADHFLSIEQALGVPVGQPELAQAAREFVEGLHASGRLLEMLAVHGQQASIAPSP